MSYTKITPQPAARAEGLAADEIAPGLYPDEIAVELDDGTLAAVSVERHWLDNGYGVAFHGCARAIAADGSTRTAPNGLHIEATISFTASISLLATWPADALADDIAMIVLGENRKLLRDVLQADKTTARVPVIDLPQEALDAASIRHQLAAVAATESISLNL